MVPINNILLRIMELLQPLLQVWRLSVLSSEVPLKMDRCFAGEAAELTIVGLFSSVLALVYFQITSLSARIVALVTLERLLSCVLALM